MQKIKLKLMMLVVMFTGHASYSNGQTTPAKSKTKATAATCSHCGKSTCTSECSSNPKTTTIMTDSSRLKVLVPSLQSFRK